MFNAKQFLQRAFIALSLTGAMALAQAEPMSYHVVVNTTGLSGSGYFDADLGDSTGASQGLSATFSNFMGAFNGVDNSVSYNYSTTAGGFALSNAAPNYLSQQVSFGGMLSFDVLFSGPFFTGANTENSALSFGLYDIAADMISAGGFNLAGSGATRITALPNNSFIVISPNAANAVPEPTQLVLMLTALAMMGVMVKRRQG